MNNPINHKDTNNKLSDKIYNHLILSAITVSDSEHNYLFDWKNEIKYLILEN